LYSFAEQLQAVVARYLANGVHYCYARKSYRDVAAIRQPFLQVHPHLKFCFQVFTRPPGPRNATLTTALPSRSHNRPLDNEEMVLGTDAKNWMVVIIKQNWKDVKKKFQKKEKFARI